jgi:hypothetical protein
MPLMPLSFEWLAALVVLACGLSAFLAHTFEVTEHLHRFFKRFKNQEGHDDGDALRNSQLVARYERNFTADRGNGIVSTPLGLVTSVLLTDELLHHLGNHPSTNEIAAEASDLVFDDGAGDAVSDVVVVLSNLI